MTSELNKGLIFHAPLSEWAGTQDIVSKIVGVNTDTYPVIGKNGSGRRNYLYDGVNDVITLPTIAAFGATDFSVIRRVKVGALGAIRTLIGGATNAFSLHISATGYLTVLKFGGSALTASTTLLAAGTIYSLGYTRTGTTGTYYVNGVAAGTCTDTNDYSVACTLLGNGTGYFNGEDSMSRAFNYALTLAQVVNYSKPEYPIEWIDRGATGAEMVLNGTFTTDTSNWSAISGAVLSVESNTLKVTNGTAAESYARQYVTTVVGKSYVALMDLKKGTSTAYGSLGGAISGQADANSTITWKTIKLLGVATTTSLWIGCYAIQAIQDAFAYFDNVSVKQLGCLLDLNAEGMTSAYWYDKTNSLTATISGATLQIPPASNLGARMFNGTTSKIAFTGMNGLTGDITIAGRFYANSYGGGSIGRILDTGKVVLYIIVSASGRLEFTRDNTYAVSANGSAVLNTWHSYVITSTAAGVTNFYINGVLSGAADQAGGTPESSTSWCIGNRVSDSARGFDGIIEPISIYNRILDLDEIKLLNDIN